MVLQKKKKHGALNWQLPSFRGSKAIWVLSLKKSNLCSWVKTIQHFFQCNMSFFLFCALFPFCFFFLRSNTYDIFHRNPLLDSFMWSWMINDTFYIEVFRFLATISGSKMCLRFGAILPFLDLSLSKTLSPCLYFVGGPLWRMRLSIIYFSIFQP